MNIEWDIFKSKLKLNKEQSIIIKYILNRLKDRFAEICECETIDYELSPIEYLVDLKINNPGLDEKSLEEKFIDYFSREKKLGSGLTYFQFFQKACISTHEEVVKLLNDEQEEALHGLEIENVFDVVTGYDPMLDKISQQIERRKKIISNNSHTTCLIPFEFAYIDDTGDVYPCCPSKFELSIGNLNKDSLQKVWSSKAAIAVRKSMINRTFRYCDYEACEYLKNGAIEHKEKITKKGDNLFPRDINLIDRAPKIINLAYDRSCNLVCPPCRKAIHTHQDNTINIHNNIFGKELQGVHRFIISGNGDPFASKYFMDFFQNFDQKQYPDVKIKIQTNGLLLTSEKWDSIEKSHDAIDWISVSVDAATEETYKINRGGDFKKLLKNLEFVSELRKSGKIKRFYINFVVQANNYKEIKQFIELGLKLGCDLIELQSIENWGTFSKNEFMKVAIQDKSHPEHKEFLKVLDDPIFLNPSVSTINLLEFLPDYLKTMAGALNISKYDDI